MRAALLAAGAGALAAAGVWLGGGLAGWLTGGPAAPAPVDAAIVGACWFSAGRAWDRR